MAVHLLIVDALNLIRRIHAVQGTPCKDTCLHALEQLIRHSEPTHAVAVFDDEARNTGWRHQRLPDYKAGRAPLYARPLNSAAFRAGAHTVMRLMI